MTNRSNCAVQHSVPLPAVVATAHCHLLRKLFGLSCCFRMHSACTFRQSRLCSTWAISQHSSQYLTVRPREARRNAPLTACTRSYVGQVESHLHSSDLQEGPSAPSADSPVQMTSAISRSKLDESLPYVAVLKARKEHKHPVQEKQKPLGISAYQAYGSGKTAVFVCCVI